jgi:hypothetical protein
MGIADVHNHFLGYGDGFVFGNFQPAIAVSATGGQEPISARTILLNLTMILGRFGVPNVDIVYWTLFVDLKFFLIVYLLLATGNIGYAEAQLHLWLAESAFIAF